MIQIQSPTRIDLTGGTLDMWPLYSFIGPSVTINGAISIYTQVQLTPLEGAQIHIEMKDLAFDQSFDNLAMFLSAKDKKLRLVQELVSFFQPKQGFKLVTQSGSPVGGGLGGSSSLMVSLIKAFRQWLPQADLGEDVHKWVQIAHNLEARILQTPTGTQDYYPAFLGGVNALTYTDRGIETQALPQDLLPLKNKGFLVDTGRSHMSGLNNFDVLARVVRKEDKVLLALKKIQSISYQTFNAIKANQKVDWLKVFEQEYAARIELSPEFTSPEIQKLDQICRSLSGVGLKILGAGGGGCVLVWSALTDKSKVCLEIEKAGFRTIEIEWAKV